MGRISRWAVHRPALALVVWLLIVVAFVAAGAAFKGVPQNSFSLPNTESAQAQALLAQLPGGGQTGGTSINVVWSPTSGTVTDASVREAITPVLKSIAATDRVACVVSPYGDRFGSACPKPPAPPQIPPTVPPQIVAELKAAVAAAQKASSPISPDGTVAYAVVTFSGDASDLPSADLTEIANLVEGANSATVQVGATGALIDSDQSGPGSSEGVGILAAIIILLIAFGSLIAAGMPIITAAIGIIAGQALILLLERVFDVATFAPELAIMIGLGVGIDYALFVLSRYRAEVLGGAEPKAAALTAVSTAGRAVLFAGSTVVIALLGLMVLGVSFFYGLAIAAAVTVLMVMTSALFMLPAVLSLLGRHALGLRLPWARHPRTVAVDDTRWARYGGLLQRAPWLAGALSLVFVAVLAIPAFSIRQGFPDDSQQPAGTPARIGFDLMAKGFGPGVNGPFYLAVQLPKAQDYQVLGQVIETLASTPGVASTTPNKDMLPLYQYLPNLYNIDGLITSVIVQPTTAPADAATGALLRTLRDEVEPQILQQTGAKVYAGGTQAIAEDFTSVLISVLPLFLTVVIGLGFLALMLLFRSLVIPLTAAVTSLLSFGAALGITVMVFQFGWGANLIGVSSTGPILPFLPVMVFAILFGLSMDYQVFLVSRMQESWRAGEPNAVAVRHGLGGSGRVVVIAALIMSSVFLAFVPTPNDTIKVFGVALASAVIIDAFIVRLVLIPSVMTVLGRANWWLPGWLDRRLPRVSVE